MLRLPVANWCALVVMATSHCLINRVLFSPLDFLLVSSEIFLTGEVPHGRLIENTGNHGVWTLFALLIVLDITLVDALFELSHSALLR